MLLEEQKIKGIISTLERLTTDETLPLSKYVYTILHECMDMHLVVMYIPYLNQFQPFNSHMQFILN